MNSRKYDLITILRSQDAAQVEETKKGISALLGRYKAEVLKEEDWGQKRLYHEINHENAGHFYYYGVKVKPEQVKAIAHDLGIQPGVIRHMFKNAE